MQIYKELMNQVNAFTESKKEQQAVLSADIIERIQRLQRLNETYQSAADTQIKRDAVAEINLLKTELEILNGQQADLDKLKPSSMAGIDEIFQKLVQEYKEQSAAQSQEAEEIAQQFMQVAQDITELENKLNSLRDARRQMNNEIIIAGQYLKEGQILMGYEKWKYVNPGLSYNENIHLPELRCPKSVSTAINKALETLENIYTGQVC